MPSEKPLRSSTKVSLNMANINNATGSAERDVLSTAQKMENNTSGAN